MGYTAYVEWRETIKGRVQALDCEGFRCMIAVLKVNSNYELFKDLCLENSTLSTHGSMVPCMQARINCLSSLLPLFSGVKYLNHRRKVEHDIEAYLLYEIELSIHVKPDG